MNARIAFIANILLCLLLILSANIYAENQCTLPIATFQSVQGVVEFKPVNVNQWHTAKLGNSLCNGDSIRLAENSRAALYLENETVLRLDENTHIILSLIDEKKPSWLEVLKGMAHFISRTPKPLEIKTPYANAAIEGTEFVVRVNTSGKNQASVTVLEGKVRTSNEKGDILLSSGQTALVIEGKIPVLKINIDPWDAVNWTLHYPSLSLYTGKRPENIPTKWANTYKRSIELLDQGDISGAISTVANIPDKLQNDQILLYKAVLHLTVGQVVLANNYLNQAQEINISNAEVFALQSIIAVTQNRNSDAIELAQTANKLDPKNLSTWIALSYAQQANYNLNKAKYSIEQAVNIAPDSAVAWARLAELHLMFGELDDALKAANYAVKIAPNLSRALNVLGFSQLTNLNLAEAELAFNKAIKLDQADPLPRLGLGLVKIRRGDLTAGRVQVEVAVSLAPTNALIRSYLGKSYYEEKRNSLAESQLTMAKALDASDPTPWFYDAIRKQSENRPVEALMDLKKSTALNKNRAVYRSRLLLDEDIAARRVGQARIYNHLGFHQLALNKGWDSLSIDGKNSSAHRFLSDSYANVPRHQIARVSELLQAQLWQPLSINTIQPQLAETNLSILNGASSSDSSHNEYGSLFVRNQIHAEVNGILGSDGVRGDDVVISGIYNRMALSLGQFHYESDGYRENNDHKLDIYNILFQLALTPRTNIQLESKFFKREKGDLVTRFFSDGVLKNQRESEDREMYRVGIRHDFSNKSKIIFSTIYGKNTSEQDDLQIVETNLVNETDSITSEIQHIWKNQVNHITSGVGYFSSNRDQKLTVVLPNPINPSFPPIEDIKTDQDKTKHLNGYSYIQNRQHRNFTWIAGLSYDYFDGPKIEKKQLNPKLGFIFKPRTDTTLRLAALRVLRRSMVTNQTIEPTQVAGFNQFYDDINGTDSKKVGFAFDHRASKRSFFGFEVSQRIINAPAPLDDRSVTTWDEHIHRGYYYYVLNSSTTLKLEYQFEILDADDIAFRYGAKRLETHTVPVGLVYSNGAGWGLNAVSKLVNQSGEFKNNTIGKLISGHDRFVVMDAGISYQFPKRLGKVDMSIKNLLNQSFNFQESDPNRFSIYPKRFFSVRLNLSLF